MSKYSNTQKQRDYELAVESPAKASDELARLRAELEAAQEQLEQGRRQIATERHLTELVMRQGADVARRNIVYWNRIQLHRRAARNVAEWVRGVWGLYNDACDDAGRTIRMNNALRARAVAEGRGDPPAGSARQPDRSSEGAHMTIDPTALAEDHARLGKEYRELARANVILVRERDALQAQVEKWRTLAERQEVAYGEQAAELAALRAWAREYWGPLEHRNGCVALTTDTPLCNCGWNKLAALLPGAGAGEKGGE